MVTKTFVYNVDGVEFTGTEAFGKAWKEVVALAKEKHTSITRKVTIVEQREEFFTNGGVFLEKEFYESGREKIF